MSLASLVTMRKAATISGILLGIAVLEYIVIMHLYIGLQEKQQFAVGGITTEAMVPVLEDWGARLQKVATQNAETAKRTFKDSKKLQNLREMIKLKKRASNISDTKPLEMENKPHTITRTKPWNTVKRDRKEPLRHPLESDADDASYREEENHVTPSSVEDGARARGRGTQLRPSPVGKKPPADPLQSRDLKQVLGKPVPVLTKHSDKAVPLRPGPARGARLRPPLLANPEQSELRKTTRTKPLDNPPEDGPGRSETVMRGNPLRMLHLRSRNQSDGERRTKVADRISTKGRSPIGRWGPPTAAAAAAAGGGGGEGEQHQNEEKKTSEDYVDSLLVDYMMEMERADRVVKQPNARFPIDESEFEIVETEHGISVVKKQLGPEVLVENDTRPYRTLTKFEKEGGNIMFTLRTTLSYHEGRLPLMFDTWMSETDCSRIFLVTDGYDWVTQAKVRLKEMHYEVTSCGRSYHQLCCKAGVEMELLFKPGNEKYDWLCHIDDDMYVLPKNLIKTLSKFNPRKEPVYFGRSGSEWYKPRRVGLKATLSKPGKKYHFAVGGMYCLSRAMLEEARDYLVGGEAFAASCRKTGEPEDVTVGLVVGAVLNHVLSRTEMIYTHGLHLSSTVDPYTLDEQIAFSYGYGSFRWGSEPYNAIFVPDGLFSVQEDESQFKSLHCHLYPTVPWCMAKKEQLKSRQYDHDYY